MRLRKLTAAAVAVLAVTGLAACKSNAGVAATVGDHRISESQITKYVEPGAKPIESNGTTILQKTYVLQTLILEQLIPRALEQNGGPAKADELNPIRQQYLQGSQESDVVTFLTGKGFKREFEPVYVETQLQLRLLAQRVNTDQQGTQLYEALTKLNLPVSLNPRYGSWDAKTFVITTANGAGLPPFLKLSGTTAAPAA